MRPRGSELVPEKAAPEPAMGVAEELAALLSPPTSDGLAV